MDRDAIERHDFPVGRRGYDRDAVDAHLRRVADEMEGLRERAAAPRAASGLSAGASDRVREILDAAEHTASEIRSAAEREAGDHVARVGEAAAAMMSRLDQLQRELDGLLEGLRSSGKGLEDGLARLHDDVRGLAPALDDEPAGDGPRGLGDEPAGDGPPRLGGDTAEAPGDDVHGEAAAPEPALDEPADPAAFAPDAPDEAGARLIALNMALAGTPREEAAAYLADHYDLPDPDALLDDVYARIDPPAA